MHLCILGRQPELSLAELEAVFGHRALTPLNDETVLVETQHVEIDRFGGLLKVGTVVAESISDNNEALLDACLAALPLADSKITLGISWYGSQLSSKQAFSFALALKKQARRQNLNVRIVPNKQPALSTAQVLHNRLTEEGNAELLVTKTATGYSVAKTNQVQDIEAYTARDRNRPARDAKVGMLPPKLAQIMINLATGRQIGRWKLVDSRWETINNPAPNSEPLAPTVLDCFCGTGVILQEALLKGFDVCGSDLEPRMVNMTRTNLEWLAKESELGTRSWKLEVGDARKLQWGCPFDAVASEIYLGPPLNNEPAADKLTRIVAEIDSLLIDTLKNIAQQAKSGTCLCLAVPAWRTKSGFKRLPSIDALEDIGYNHLSFASVHGPLIYARSGQIVARELVVLERT